MAYGHKYRARDTILAVGTAAAAHALAVAMLGTGLHRALLYLQHQLTVHRPGAGAVRCACSMHVLALKRFKASCLGL